MQISEEWCASMKPVWTASDSRKRRVFLIRCWRRSACVVLGLVRWFLSSGPQYRLRIGFLLFHVSWIGIQIPCLGTFKRLLYFTLSLVAIIQLVNQTSATKERAIMVLKANDNDIFNAIAYLDELKDLLDQPTKHQLLLWPASRQIKQFEHGIRGDE